MPAVEREREATKKSAITEGSRFYQVEAIALEYQWEISKYKIVESIDAAKSIYFRVEGRVVVVQDGLSHWIIEILGNVNICSQTHNHWALGTDSAFKRGRREVYSDWIWVERAIAKPGNRKGKTQHWKSKIGAWGQGSSKEDGRGGSKSGFS